MVYFILLLEGNVCDVVRSPQLAHFYTRPWGREVWVPPEMGIGGWAAHTKHSLSLSLSDNSTN